MKKNESKLDRIIRIFAGVILLALYFAGTVSGTLGIVFIVVGALLLVTGLVGYCPLYGLLKLTTNKS